MPINTPVTGGIATDGIDQSGIDFEDEPINTVTQDNIDVSCIIGPHSGDTLSAGDKPDGGREYFVADIEVHLSKGPESNYAIGVIVPNGHNRKPSVGDPLDDTERPDIITIDVDNELTEASENRRDSEITRIFTGVISNASRIERGLYEFTAFWPGHSAIQNSDVNVSNATVNVEPTTVNGEEVFQPQYRQARQYTSKIAEIIAEEVTSDNRFDYTIDIIEGGYSADGVVQGADERITVESSFQKITQGDPDTGILQRVVNASNSVWDIDRYGNFHIGPPNSDLGKPTSVNSHKLRYITETDAGKQSPEWQSVLVIGDGIVSQDGWDANAQIAEKPATRAESVIEEDATEEDIKRDQLAKPIFEYVNLEINTADEAKHALKKIKDKIREQSGSGEVTVVGHPEIWPGDSIELPDSKSQPYASERFGVLDVTHRINNSDGFLTKLKVGGLTKSQEVIYEGAPKGTTNERYDANYTEEEVQRVKEQFEESGTITGL